jgi:hypothetical protein
MFAALSLAGASRACSFSLDLRQHVAIAPHGEAETALGAYAFRDYASMDYHAQF